jgi:phosphoglycerate dehydrogenase-like enzyme
VFDPGVDASLIAAAGCQPASFETLLAEADIVTLHCPSNEQTRHLLNAASIGTMKEHAILVNVGRGDLAAERRDLKGGGGAMRSRTGVGLFFPQRR